MSDDYQKRNINGDTLLSRAVRAVGRVIEVIFIAISGATGDPKVGGALLPPSAPPKQRDEYRP
ncbi:MAG: hypothetical protein V4479_07810 [Actinomycetota bacterium]